MSWEARLAIEYQKREQRSYIAKIQHQGPLMVQKSFYPEACPTVHNYLIHPPGGLVGGDEISIDISLADETSVLITTPAAGKIYKTVSAESKSQVRLQLGAESELFWLPQENIVFDGAHHRMRTSLDVHPTARFSGWDILCLGRPGAHEQFTKGRIASEWRLSSMGNVQFLERMNWEGGDASLQKPWGLANFPVLGSMFLHWPDWPDLREWVGDLSQDGVEVAATLREDWYLARSRSHCPLLMRARFLQILTSLSEFVLGKPFQGPRIWAY